MVLTISGGPQVPSGLSENFLGNHGFPTTSPCQAGDLAVPGTSFLPGGQGAVITQKPLWVK